MANRPQRLFPKLSLTVGLPILLNHPRSPDP